MYYNSIPAEDRQGPLIDTEKYPAKLGITLELCAGIVDKNKSLSEIAAEEILEECGYKVDHEKLERIIQFRYLLLVQPLHIYSIKITKLHFKLQLRRRNLG